MWWCRASLWDVKCNVFRLILVIPKEFLPRDECSIAAWILMKKYESSMVWNAESRFCNCGEEWALSSHKYYFFVSLTSWIFFNRRRWEGFFVLEYHAVNVGRLFKVLHYRLCIKYPSALFIKYPFIKCS